MIKIKVLHRYFLLLIGFICAQSMHSALLNKKSTYTEKDILVDVSDALAQKSYPKNFQVKYKELDFVYTEKAAVESVFQRFINWLSRRLASLFETTNSEQATNYALLFIKLLALLIILIAVYFIVKIILKKEGNWIFGSSNQNKIDYDSIDENLKNIDFQKLIEQTNKTGNNRLEIRYYYLWVLKKLSEKEFVTIHPEKTNSDYYNEINNAAVKADFKYVSYLYNYIWYGEFDLTIETYEHSKDSFLKMLQSI